MASVGIFQSGRMGQVSRQALQTLAIEQRRSPNRGEPSASPLLVGGCGREAITIATHTLVGFDSRCVAVRTKDRWCRAYAGPTWLRERTPYGLPVIAVHRGIAL